MTKIEKMHFPESTAVRGIAYDARRQVLDVAFVDGGAYRYFGVPEEVFDRFRYAESAGRFMHEEILEQYEFERLG